MNEGNKMSLSQIRKELIELYKRRQELIKEQSEAESRLGDANSIDNGVGRANSAAKNMESGKTLTLSNGHSILGDNNKFNGGFINLLIMALLAGFASGAIATAIYIFTTLSKVTVSL